MLFLYFIIDVDKTLLFDVSNAIFCVINKCVSHISGIKNKKGNLACVI